MATNSSDNTSQYKPKFDDPLDFKHFPVEMTEFVSSLSIDNSFINSHLRLARAMDVEESEFSCSLEQQAALGELC